MNFPNCKPAKKDEFSGSESSLSTEMDNLNTKQEPSFIVIEFLILKAKRKLQKQSGRKYK